jgi:hypothetical protein
MTTSLNVLIIEDDAMHTTSICDAIRAKWSGHAFTFYQVTNELEFINRFEEFATIPIDSAVIDQMIPYTTRDDTQLHAEAKELSAFRGGSRCYERLRKDPRTTAVPIVFFSILSQESMPLNAELVKKSGDPKLTEFLEAVGRVLNLPI